MRKIFNRVMVVLFFITTSLFAEDFDPYYVNIDCYSKEGYCFMTDGFGRTLFHFDEKLLNKITSRRNKAQLEQKKLHVAVNDIVNKKSILVNAKYCPIWVPVSFLTYSSAIVDQIVKVSNVPLDFKFIKINTDKIKSLLYYYKLIEIDINGDTNKYWLTGEQRKYLLEIIKSGAQYLEINLSALEYDKLYRDLIPARKVFTQLGNVN